MIPKTIHYSWLSGDPFPPLIQSCIESWKRLHKNLEKVFARLRNKTMESFKF